MKTKKNNLGLALILSMLAALAGAVVFGIVYAIGFYIYLLAIMEIILACTVFLIYKPATKWTIVVFAIVWSFVWSFAFNIMAVVVCEAIAVANELHLSLSQSIKLVMDAWKNNADVAAYMNTRVGQILAMIFIGGVAYGGYFIANIIKAKKQGRQAKQQPEKVADAPKIENAPETKTNTFLSIFESCRKAYQIYQNNKNVELFNQNMNKIKSVFVEKLSDVEKSIMIAKCEKKMAESDATEEDVKVAKIVLTIMK